MVRQILREVGVGVELRILVEEVVVAYLPVVLLVGVGEVVVLRILLLEEVVVVAFHPLVLLVVGEEVVELELIYLELVVVVLLQQQEVEEVVN